MKARRLAINVTCPAPTPEKMSREPCQASARNPEPIKLTNLRIE